ncbi:hypothetical protein JCM2811A_10850 [Methylorubrum rhodinum]
MTGRHDIAPEHVRRIAASGDALPLTESEEGAQAKMIRQSIRTTFVAGSVGRRAGPGGWTGEFVQRSPWRAVIARRNRSEQEGPVRKGRRTPPQKAEACLPARGAPRTVRASPRDDAEARQPPVLKFSISALRSARIA